MNQTLMEIGDTIKAQTALQAQRDFPGHVYEFLEHQIIKTRSKVLPRRRPNFFSRRVPENPASEPEHYFFIYHPANDWQPKFFETLRKKAKQGIVLKRFMGLSENLHIICWWMKAIRDWIHTHRPEQLQPEFHLLMPAYRSVFIVEKCTFPEELYPLAIEGQTDASGPYVQLNLMKEQSDDLSFSISRMLHRNLAFGLFGACGVQNQKSLFLEKSEKILF